MSTVQENREAKGRLIARHLWRHDMTIADLFALPYSQRQAGPTMVRFARAAHAAGGDPDRAVPSRRESDTWRIVAEKLDVMEARQASGETVPERDLTGERGRWLLASANELPAGTIACGPGPVTADDATAVREFAEQLRELGRAPDSGASEDDEPGEQSPRGWAELASMPPLDYGKCVHHPDRRPVVITLDGGRCADCPPRPDELKDEDAWVGRRNGWGIALDWTPKHCNAGPEGRVRCYCGRCPMKETAA